MKVEEVYVKKSQVVDLLEGLRKASSEKTDVHYEFAYNQVEIEPEAEKQHKLDVEMIKKHNGVSLPSGGTHFPKVEDFDAFQEYREKLSEVMVKFNLYKIPLSKLPTKFFGDVTRMLFPIIIDDRKKEEEKTEVKKDGASESNS